MNDTRHSRDRGSVLALVLVAMVVGSLWVVPLLSYTTSVLRSNQVLSAQTQRIESVKAGFRVALADPVALYEACDQAGEVELADLTLGGVGVASNCRLIDARPLHDDTELRYAVTATQAGQSAPSFMTGQQFVPDDPASTVAWSQNSSAESETDRVWLPRLPAHQLTERTADGYSMPPGSPACTVYFPGTYPDRVTLDGPTFFTSGVYYFEDEISVVSGADVVVGDGPTTGCTTDIDAAFNAQNAPVPHNIGGLGATWVLGGAARLIVDNSAGAELALRFNQRYVDDEESRPSADVSIISVNGALDDDGTTGIDLDMPDVVRVPLSVVGGASPTAATELGYVPSVHTPAPNPPVGVDNVVATPYSGAAIVTWDAPDSNAASRTTYTVTASSGEVCTTGGASTCALTGLANATPVTFAVVATNASGSSAPSDESAPVTPRADLQALGTPWWVLPPQVTPYDGAIALTWRPPLADGGAPVTGFTVEADDEGGPTGQTCSVAMDVADPPALACTIENLTNGREYTFEVVATNAVGDSLRWFTSRAIAPESRFGDAPTDPVDPVAYRVPPAIVDLDLADRAPATVSIPGYIAIPQGRFRLDNPRGHGVEIVGGLLAAQFDATDGRDAGPESVEIGFIPQIVQRKLQIVTTTAEGDESSTAIVQVNRNGAYAINSWRVQ